MQKASVLCANADATWEAAEAEAKAILARARARLLAEPVFTVEFDAETAQAMRMKSFDDQALVQRAVAAITGKANEASVHAAETGATKFRLTYEGFIHCDIIEAVAAHARAFGYSVFHRQIASGDAATVEVAFDAVVFKMPFR